MKYEGGLTEPAHVVLVRGGQQLVVYQGGVEDCEAWLALNGDKVSTGEGHFEMRNGPPPGRSAALR
jgi:hypothetical protein